MIRNRPRLDETESERRQRLKRDAVLSKPAASPTGFRNDNPKRVIGTVALPGFAKTLAGSNESECNANS
jgi:hypothetical protein